MAEKEKNGADETSEKSTQIEKNDELTSSLETTAESDSGDASEDVESETEAVAAENLQEASDHDDVTQVPPQEKITESSEDNETINVPSTEDNLISEFSDDEMKEAESNASSNGPIQSTSEENSTVPASTDAHAYEDKIKATQENDKGEKDKKELNTEEDLDEKDSEEEDEEQEDIDYSQLSKEELVSTIKVLAKDENIIISDSIARDIKPFFDEIRNKERSEALERFVADGGEEKDFDFKFDELANRFDANFKLIHDRKVQYVKDRERQKELNLKKKEDVLERLRAFVDSEDPNMSFNDFKEFQNEWKAIGPVPPSYARTLWANYNALIDRFYDHRNIYFELKELDRKKNLELKLELCEKAEQLSKTDNLPEAIKALNELHHEFKHIGPVPQDDQEPLWQRFKTASDAVYDNRKDFVEQLKIELEQNLVIKAELAESAQFFVQFDTDRIKEWNNKTKELLELQKKWEAVGGLPRAKAKEVNKRFWGAFKTNFHNKGAFFKKLDSQREANLDKKKDSTDWNNTAETFKKLQRQWREIGPVPEKFRESVYQEFKKACDYFFDQRRGSQNEAEKEYIENYNQKSKV